MKRKGIPWDNFVMKKYGVSIKKEIFMAHTPFLRVTTALRIAETGALVSKGTDTVQ